MALGNQLVAQLSDPERADTLSRWVAHYIAEQIILAKRTKGRAKAAAEERCFQSILTLWSHRESLPNGVRPLEEFEGIFDMLARLDPENPRARWHSLGPRADEEGESAEATQLIGFIFSIDRVARELINTALRAAIARAMKPETRLYVSQAIPADSPGKLDLIRKIIDRFEDKEAEKGDIAKVLARRQEQAAELAKFCMLCHDVQRLMQSEIEALQASVQPPT